MKDVDSEKSGTRDVPPNFVIATEYISPLQRQLLGHRIHLSNIPAGTQDQAVLDRETQKLNLLERLVEAEQANNPPYAVTRLVDLNDDFENEDDFPDGDTFGSSVSPETKLKAQGEKKHERSSGLRRAGCRLFEACGLDVPWGDLLEEHHFRLIASGRRAADTWLLNQMLRSIPRLLPKAAKSLVVIVIEAAAINALGASLSALLTAWLAEIVRRIAH